MAIIPIGIAAPTILIPRVISLTILIVFVVMPVLALPVMLPVPRSFSLPHLIGRIIRPVALVILVVMVLVPGLVVVVVVVVLRGSTG